MSPSQPSTNSEPDRSNLTAEFVRRLPVLTYHSLDTSGSVISTPPALFEWQMNRLHSHGWRSLRLDLFLNGLKGGVWPARTFLLAFDDGFLNFREKALPVLTNLNYWATVFVVSNWVGRRNDWPGQRSDVPSIPLMAWDDLCLAAEVGCEIGAHSVSHQHWAHLEQAERKREILGCRQALEDRLGRKISTYAYPYGETDLEAEELVTEGFRAGFGTRLGFVTPASRATVLERIDMYYLRRNEFFEAFVNGWLDWYLNIRQCLRDWRQTGVTRR